LSLAVLEVLVHVPPHLWPDQAEAFAITLPDHAVIETLNGDAAGLNSPGDCRIFGDRWATNRSAPAILVPSVIVPPQMAAIPTGESNALLNPAFAVEWAVARTAFRLDERLRRAAL